MLGLLGVRSHELPSGPLIIGYQSWSSCNLTQTMTAAYEGVNVVIWFATNLASVNGTATVTGGPDYECVKSVADALEFADLPTTHLISIGGWDAPHPVTAWDGREWYGTWKAWNEALPRPFEGFDWDLEGNDDVTATSNHFTQACLDLVIAMSEAAKEDGYLVSMVRLPLLCSSLAPLERTSRPCVPHTRVVRPSGAAPELHGRGQRRVQSEPREFVPGLPPDLQVPRHELLRLHLRECGPDNLRRRHRAAL